MSHIPCFVTREQPFVCDSHIRTCVRGSLGQSQDRGKLVVVSCFQSFFPVLALFSFQQEDSALGCHSMKL